ncbi:hypothetical protein GA0061099_1004451 [Bradyrhizobium yuanmingense]|uniref:Uncharacterized protein n=1 Tax=Bradyrhizobium yuanmingense TaxID=108015 RepID=A0A1C3VRM0_9BRAD|nr:hypothetical protein [Bradyrhizobium yuanmingense]TWI28863.1 hypothetical protein IQ15_02210 [Bradyrhizobium yuanmingense]SCB30349.1 hypothetical protein GA0061099_1004451 [Bradyrhizobium yuanmingense]
MKMHPAALIGPPPQVDEWATFLANAIAGVRAASEQMRARRAKHEKRIDWFRDKKSGIPRENSVTRAIADEFKRLKARQGISGTGVQPMDLRHISIECEVPRPYDPGISDKAKPTDIAFSLFKDGVLDLRIEAKTITSIADLKTYIGSEGLLRFEDGSNPYTVAPFGGMVAYVVDEDADSWDRRIASRLKEALGAERTYVTTIGTAIHQVSTHNFVLTTDEGTAAYEVGVVHLAIEIDAVPSRRP